MKRKQTNRRATATLLLLILVISIISPLVLASNAAPQPRYIAVSGMTCDFDIGVLGISSPSGSVILRDGYTADLSLIIMQSSDASSWISYKSWTTTGSSIVSLSEYYAVERRYFYKAVASAIVFDADGNVIEHVSIESPYKYY